MTSTETQAVAYFTIIMDNNRIGTIRAMTKNGIPIGDGASRKEMTQKLLAAFRADKQKFVKMMQSVAIKEYANNYTTDPKLVDAIYNTVEGINNDKHI